MNTINSIILNLVFIFTFANLGYSEILKNNDQSTFLQLELTSSVKRNALLLKHLKKESFRNYALTNKSIFSDSIMANLAVIKSLIHAPVKNDSSPIFHRSDRRSAEDKAELEALIDEAITTMIGFHEDLNEKSSFSDQLKLMNNSLEKALKITSYKHGKNREK